MTYIDDAKKLAFQYNIHLSEFLRMTPYELSLFTQARHQYDLEQWQTLSYILTGKKPQKQLSLDEIDQIFGDKN